MYNLFVCAVVDEIQNIGEKKKTQTLQQYGMIKIKRCKQMYHIVYQKLVNGTSKGKNGIQNLKSPTIYGFKKKM